MSLNIFDHYYLPHGNLRNWPDNIKAFFRTFKYAYQRCRYGIADSDIWNLDYHLEELFSYSLKKLADSGIGYPATEEFPTIESWHNALYENSKLLNKKYDNPYEYIWDNIDMNIDNSGKAIFINEPSDDLKDKFYDRVREINSLHKKDRETAINWMLNHWDNLWD